ncbi:MAG: hypothetical protein NVSMB7_08030 [Chitinophagaceae bacterium]
MLKKISAASIGFLSFASIHAQTDSTKKPVASTTFIYSVDAYYRYDFNDAPASVASPFNNLTSFTNSKNSFELGMASIRADHSFGKIAATADLGFGRRAEEFSYNDGQSPAKNGFLTLAAVKQLYISYAPSSAIKFTIGKWATHVGYELLDAYANRNYSMSYGFSYGPFFHTGLKADISLGGKSAFMIGVANPTDFSTTTSGDKVLLAQFSTGTKNDKLKAYLNFQGGNGFNQFDLVLNGVLSSQFGINYDGTVKSVKTAGVSNSWTSNALYFNYDPTSKFGLTLRGEYFDDTKSVAGVGTSIFQTTLSGNIHLDNLTLIPEIRLDNAKDNAFFKSSGAGTKSDASFILAAVYKF